MNTPEKCPKCGVVNLRFIDRNTSQFNCGSVSRNRTVVIQTALCTTNERDQLAKRVRELEAWKESALAVEREWDPNKLATMLGGQLGESQRAVIHREVPKLVERVKRLEEAGDVMAKLIPFAIGDDEDESWANHMMSYNKARCRGAVVNWNAAKSKP